MGYEIKEIVNIKIYDKESGKCLLEIKSSETNIIRAKEQEK